MQNFKNHLLENVSSQPKLFGYLMTENKNNFILRYSNPERLKNILATKVSSYFFNKDNKVMNSLSLFVRDNLEEKDLQVRLGVILNNLEGSKKSKR